MQNDLSSENTIIGTPRPLRVLVVEDLLADAYLLNEAFIQWGGIQQLDRAETVSDALRLLEEMAQAGCCPDVIIVDINLPGENGFELLSALKAEPRWRHIPTVMLSGSADERERIRSQSLAAAGYLVKPVRFEDYIDVVGSILAFVKPPVPGFTGANAKA